MTYYKDDKVEVRDAIYEDVSIIARDMRETDKNEVWASHNHTPLQSLHLSFTLSTICLTVKVCGKAVAMFGVVPCSFLGDTGSIWLLATPGFSSARKRLIKKCRAFIQYFLSFYPVLVNWVDDRNIASIVWLKFCGAEMGESEPYGAEQLPFRRFQFTRRDYAHTFAL